MGDLFQPTHLMIIGILLLVLFGAKRLPELGKGLGEGLKGFKEGLKNDRSCASRANRSATSCRSRDAGAARCCKCCDGVRHLQPLRWPVRESAGL
jgi:TatA/E family protein of Tat protein translocase